MNKKNNAISLVIYLIGFFAVIALAFSIYALMRLDMFDKSSMKSEQNIRSTTARFRFCYDNQIRPCDDTTIQRWNDSHPADQQFRIVP